MAPRLKTVPLSLADVSLADVSLADVSLADVSLADVSLTDVSLADVSSDTSRLVAEGKLRRRRQRVRISSLAPVTPRSKRADVLLALAEDRQEGP